MPILAPEGSSTVAPASEPASARAPERAPPPPGAGAKSAPQLPADLSHIVFAGGTGLDCQHPITIEHAKNSGEGMAAEKAWLTAKYPGARKREQAIGLEGNKHVEGYSLTLSDGSSVNVCFDISDFFGRW